MNQSFSVFKYWVLFLGLTQAVNVQASVHVQIEKTPDVTACFSKDDVDQLQKILKIHGNSIVSSPENNSVLLSLYCKAQRPMNENPAFPGSYESAFIFHAHVFSYQRNDKTRKFSLLDEAGEEGFASRSAFFEALANQLDQNAISDESQN